MKTTAAAVVKELEKLGTERCKRVLMRNHGVEEPCFGVKIGDMQPIRKRLGTDYRLALDLYGTGIYDAMYLAGLIADDAQMTREDLGRWVNAARCGSLPGATVAAVAAGSGHGWDLALEWIESPVDHIAVAGWSTLSHLVALKSDSELDLPALKRLLERVKRMIHGAPDPVRYAMNGFVISVGCFMAPLTANAVRTAEAIGPVEADLGPNACQVPSAADYIRKVEARGTIGRKRKSVKC